MNDTNVAARPTLDEYLGMQYRLDVIADPEGGYVLEYPDLPGCMSQVESLTEVGEVAEEIRRLWLETAYDYDMEIPLPSYPEEYSGKFNLRLPKSLHRRLAESAARDEVSLNQHVVGLLSEGVALGEVLSTLRSIAGAQEHIRATLDELAVRVDALSSERTTGQTEAAPGSRARAA